MTNTGACGGLTIQNPLKDDAKRFFNRKLKSIDAALRFLSSLLFSAQKATKKTKRKPRKTQKTRKKKGLPSSIGKPTRLTDTGCLVQPPCDTKHILAFSCPSCISWFQPKTTAESAESGPVAPELRFAQVCWRCQRAIPKRQSACLFVESRRRS